MCGGAIGDTIWRCARAILTNIGRRSFAEAIIKMTASAGSQCPMNPVVIKGSQSQKSWKR